MAGAVWEHGSGSTARLPGKTGQRALTIPNGLH